jgi:phosphoglycolate/pyridoxal phosphate phosphatase family enzyme
VRAYRLYIFDLDGTLYRGAEVIPGAVETVRELRRRGAMIRFLTNNSGQTRAFYQAKLEKMGFSPSPEEISSSAIGAAKVCAERGLRSVFYVGEPGLQETLADGGLQVVNSGEELAPDADAVVAGICRTLTYRWMNSALQQLLAGACFIATNTDATYPIENGKVEPGAGAIVASIKAASGIDPQVIGKPNPLLVEMVLKETGVAKADALAVGDRYETDILSGENAGIDTHLVLTGITQTAPAGVSHSATLTGLIGE